MNHHAARFLTAIGTGASHAPAIRPRHRRTRRELLATFAPSEKKSIHLLAWIDRARAATWPTERIVLGLMTLIGLVLLLALRAGLIAP